MTDKPVIVVVAGDHREMLESEFRSRHGRDVPRELWENGRPPAILETSVRGVLAAGDVRSGSMKRAASASGAGASVAPLLRAHLAWRRSQEFRPLR